MMRIENPLMSLIKNNEYPVLVSGSLCSHTVNRPLDFCLLSHEVDGATQLVLTPLKVNPGQVLLSDERHQLFLFDENLLSNGLLTSASIRRIYGAFSNEEYDLDERKLYLQAAISSGVISCRSPFTQQTNFYYGKLKSIPLALFRELQLRVEVISCSSNGKYWKFTRPEDRSTL